MKPCGCYPKQNNYSLHVQCLCKEYMDSCQRLDLIDYIFLCIHLFSAFHLNILSLLSCIMCVKCRECYVKHAHPLRCSSKYSISKMKRMSFRHEFGSRFLRLYSPARNVFSLARKLWRVLETKHVFVFRHGLRT